MVARRLSNDTPTVKAATMYTDTPTRPLHLDELEASTQLLITPSEIARVRTIPRQRRSAPIALVILAVILLAALVVTIIVVAGRAVQPPAAIDAPIVEGPAVDPVDIAPPVEAAPDAAAPQPVAPTPPVIDTFAASNQTVLCNTQSPTPSPQYLSFTWSVSDAVRVYFGTDTADASAAPLFNNLPLSGTSTLDFPAGYNDYTYNCPNASRTYTLTAVDADGLTTSQSVVVVNNGDTV
jgi:hypothetical protein